MPISFIFEGFGEEDRRSNLLYYVNEAWSMLFEKCLPSGPRLQVHVLFLWDEPSSIYKNCSFRSSLYSDFSRVSRIPLSALVLVANPLVIILFLALAYFFAISMDDIFNPGVLINSLGPWIFLGCSYPPPILASKLS